MSDAAERIARELVGACGTSCTPACPCAAYAAARIRAYARKVAEAVRYAASVQACKSGGNGNQRRATRARIDTLDLDAILAAVTLPEEP